MEVSLHSRFDRLWIWFSETEEPNTYKLEGARDVFTSQLPKYVTFSTPDPENLPLPGPTYLAIHAACTKIAYLSGANNPKNTNI